MAKTILVDFDGTISPVHYPGALTEPPYEGAVEALRHFRENGYKIIIWSCRANPSLNANYFGNPFKEITRNIEEMIDYLDRYEIPYDGIDFEKPYFTVAIDDRAMRFDGDWSKIKDHFDKYGFKKDDKRNR